ncbi:SDR family oxidoreductase [Amycolatopsis sp. NPDC023774]|uniref:SDR family NAD(P)-dependent oxidoreductase n=1 Tax=Amycolatopsis sp. NPDC023774 TaxID=3155015 RepID=UPI0033D0EB89
MAHDRTVLVTGVASGIGGVARTVHEAGYDLVLVDLDEAGLARHAVGTVLTENGGGAVVNIASVPGVLPAVYAASKAGLVGFGTGLAFDFGPLGVAVDTIAPGIVRTPIRDRIQEEDADRTGLPAEQVFAEHVRPIPLGRAQTAAEIGALTVFLLGPGARSISGETVKVTGGMTTVTFDFAKAAAAVRAGVPQ